LRAHRLDEAKRELEQATQLDPNNAKAHYQLGRYYVEIHDVAHAKAEFDRTVAIQSHANRPTPPPPKQ
jgi:Tfp pilus assembly protein PilF